MNKLEGKTALVTGGTTGIGAAAAVALAAEGARVWVTGRNPERLEEAKQQLPAGVQVLASDAAKLDDINALAATLQGSINRLDIAFVNAGIAEFAPLTEATPESFARQVEVNLRGPLFTVKALLPLLGKGSSIVFNATTLATIGMPGASIYAATKAGLRSVGRTLAAELAPQQIRVNTISPGPIETPIYGKLGMPQDAVQQMASGIVEQVALKRFGSSEEVARAVVFLASDDSSYITGENIRVDGGMGTV